MKSRVIWTCSSCGNDHRWRWRDVTDGPSYMHCDECATESYGNLYRDGTTRKGRARYRWRPI